ncbi:hypothetical protein [Paracoccus sp. SSK6]|uniref:hypothetical protein n=1 Tax=Paracoccus sp. SSK6 TaxID=3143131 RepID=UPI003218E3C5
MEELEARYPLHRLDQALDKDAVLAKAGPVCMAMVVDGHVTFHATLLDRLTAPRLEACSSAGFDRMDLPAMTRRGTTLTNTSAALAEDVADAAILLMLASRRPLVEADAHVRLSDWARLGMFPLTARLRASVRGSWVLASSGVPSTPP